MGILWESGYDLTGDVVTVEADEFGFKGGTNELAIGIVGDGLIALSVLEEDALDGVAVESGLFEEGSEGCGSAWSFEDGETVEEFEQLGLRGGDVLGVGPARSEGVGYIG